MQIFRILFLDNNALSHTNKFFYISLELALKGPHQAWLYVFIVEILQNSQHILTSQYLQVISTTNRCQKNKICRAIKKQSNC